VGNALDIQATRCTVSGHQHLMHATPKTFQCLQALVLRAVAMQTDEAKSRSVQGVCKSIGS
jgi:hypothetical protein